MKVVLLAGGLGTRLAEETSTRPKPLVEIGNEPILWHIMKIFAAQGFHEFIICAGYKGYMIKDYFVHYQLRHSNITVQMETGRVQIESSASEPWTVTIVDTGEVTMTGGRIKRILPYLGDDAEFLMSYGDGVGDVDLAALLAQHRAAGRLATVTGARPPGRFGQLRIEGDAVTSFAEKPPDEGGWISAGFFVLPRSIGEYIAGDETTLEREPLERLAGEGQLGVYRHHGFWLPMDSLRDKNVLDALWQTGRAPWVIW